VDFFVKRLELPLVSEGFSKIYHVQSQVALNELMSREWGISAVQVFFSL
jgi:hypothetical protein